MMSKLSTPEPKSWSARLRVGLAGLATLAAGAVLATGCLDRPVVPAQPSTSNVFVDQIIQSAVDKIDLLFMIDNSSSMADKQSILALAVPEMVNRLVTPICVDATTQMPTGGSTPCTAPAVSEFTPIKDIHIAIVTSSLGSHGGDVCNNAVNPDDRGQTLGSVRNIPGYNNTGFLAWDPNSIDMPPGETSAPNLITAFSTMVTSAGQSGCGYEASLEAWYRFLIDPEPPDMVANVNGATVKSGLNMPLLLQRSAFLRPDSLVAIVMLTDENDCSIADSGYGWFLSTRANSAGQEQRMFRATSACATNPNSACCMSCADTSAPAAGCGATADDASCKMGTYLSATEDSVSLRCWDTKRRFGFDLMYPTRRYSNALTATTIQPDSGAAPVPNPLYDSTIQVLSGGKVGTGTRDTSLVFLAGIVGVPWQDLATADTLMDPNRLTYLSAKDMTTAPPVDRWAAILGDPNASPPILPTDPFMVETYVDRTTLTNLASQQNPIVAETLQPASSTDQQANKINGHEQNVVGVDDLQYACIFPLNPVKTCTAANAQDCDCSGPNVVAANSPLCSPPGSTNQNYAKAYPGLRELQVLHEFGNNAIPASICPKVTTMGQADYGYNPAVAAIINRLKEALHGRCLPRPLDATVNPDNPTGGTQVPCAVVEAKYNDPMNGTGCADCAGTPGRETPNPLLIPPVIKQMAQRGQCNLGGRSCSDFCFCAIKQETGPDLDACRKDPQGAAATAPPGYCYISNRDVGATCTGDPDCTTGTCAGGACTASGALLKCPPSQQQLLGFVSPANTPTPANGAIGFIACLGASISSLSGG